MINLRAPFVAPSLSDARLLPLAGAGWATSASVLLVGPRRGAFLVLVLVVALLLAVVMVRRHAIPAVHAWQPTLVALLVVVVATGSVAWCRVAALRPPPVADLVAVGGSASVDLVVTSDPQPLRGRWSNDRVRFAARLERIRTARGETRVRVPVQVFATSAWAELLPGAAVRARARFGETTFREESALLVVRGPPVVRRAPSAVQRAAGALRAGLRASVAGFGSDARGLVPGMVLGDTSGVSDELREHERVAGLTHLTAVSGANVAVLLAAVLGAARLLGARRRLLLVVGLLAVVGFVVVARPAPSVLRAAVMGCVTLIGVMRGSTGRGVQVLAAAVLALVVVDPWLSVSVGFALSVAATGALLVVATHWRERLVGGRLPRWLAEPLAVASVAHLATLPLIAAISGRVSLVAIAANLLAEPAVVVVTVAGALATVVAPVSPDLARLVALPAGWGAGWVAGVAHRAAAVPGADVGWPATPLGLTALSLLVLVTLATGARRARAGAPGRAADAVAGAWHASRDVSEPRGSRTGDARDRPRGTPRRARRRRGRHRRPRARRRRRRA